MSEIKIALALQSPSEKKEGQPKKQNMGDEALTILEAGGLSFSRRSRWDDAKTKIDGKDIGLELWFKKNREIANSIVDNEAALAIVGRDVLGETEGGSEVLVLKELGFSKCRLKFGYREDFDYQRPESLIGQRILTAYPRGTERWLNGYNIPAVIETRDTTALPNAVRIKPYGGGAETAVRKGFGVGCVEISESGFSMETNRLKPVEEDVLISEALLIANPNLIDAKGSEKIVWKTLRMIKTGLWKTQYTLLKFNYPQEMEKDIFIEDFPAMDSPTIMPLKPKEGRKEESAGETLVRLDEVTKWKDFLQLKGARSVFTAEVQKLFPDLDDPDIERMMKLIYGQSWQFRKELLAS